MRDLAKFTRRAPDTLTRGDLRADWRLYRPRAWLFPGPDGRPRSPTTLQKAHVVAKRTAGVTTPRRHPWSAP